MRKESTSSFLSYLSSYARTPLVVIKPSVQTRYISTSLAELIADYNTWQSSYVSRSKDYLRRQLAVGKGSFPPSHCMPYASLLVVETSLSSLLSITRQAFVSTYCVCLRGRRVNVAAVGFCDLKACLLVSRLLFPLFFVLEMALKVVFTSFILKLCSLPSESGDGV